MGKTPMTKNKIRQFYIFQYEGMTPMTKNINVIDENGNILGATYSKRAKGLIKNGRARLIDENTICLACPANENLEDSTMNENDIKITNDTKENEITLKLIMDKLDEVRKSFLKAEETQIALLASPTENVDWSIVDIDSETFKEAFQNYYNCITTIKNTSQTTLQQYLNIYSNIINDMKFSKTGKKD